MFVERHSSTGAFFALALALCACGTDPPPSVDGNLFPMQVGNSWSFKIYKNSADPIDEKTQSVTGTVSSAAGLAYELVTVRAGHQTKSQQRVEPDGRVLRLYEEGSEDGTNPTERIHFAPPALRVHGGMTVLGATYDAAFSEEHLTASGGVSSSVPKSQHFIVEALDEELSVPAGVFRTVRIRRETAGGSSKTYWYAFDVGKVKEVGGQTEELSAYHVGEGS